MNASRRRRPLLSWLFGTLMAGYVSATTWAGEAAEPADQASADPQMLESGRELFVRIWAPNDRRSHGGDGLGPVFNAQSCVACHDQGGTGGAGPASRNIEIVTPSAGTQYGYSYSFAMDFGTGSFQYRFGTPGRIATGRRKEPTIDRNVLASIHPGFRDAQSLVLHRFGTDVQYPAWHDSVPGQHGLILIQTAQRNPTSLFGTGLIDAIPDQVIEDGARRKSLPSKVRGRVGRTREGALGRFGWKAQTATLDRFVRSAAATEIGLEVPGNAQAADPRLPGIGASGLDMNEQECRALTAYVRSLRPPGALAADDAGNAAAIKAGESAFRSAGCNDCHVPRLGEVEGIYSDLLLHDMGPRLGDTGVYGVFVSGPNAGAPAAPDAAGAGRADEDAPASPQEWRTPPLWGLRDSAPYLHDGRAESIEQAIAMHGGQGQSAAHRYAQFSSKRKQQLETFLKSLSAPPRGDERPGIAKAL